MQVLESQGQTPDSPAFVYSNRVISEACRSLRRGLGTARARVLYSTKACTVEPVVGAVGRIVDGLAVSSPAEARLASNVSSTLTDLHLTSPGLTRLWFDALPHLTHVSFNSLSQWGDVKNVVPSAVSQGLRLNTGHSVVADKRYDPSRRHSKLGVSINEVGQLIVHGSTTGLRGLHVHNACFSRSWVPLLDTVSEITRRLEPMLAGLEWINLGGGYLWDEGTDFGPLQEAVDLLTTKYGLEVFLEPGAGIVNSAGFLVASVIDLFRSDGKTIAILDTTVNHLPEVFEYQYEPDVAEHIDDAPYEYILAGCSCLAGDLFGEYSFEEPLEIGSRVTFTNVGAYSLVKAHMFNGINLPSVYMLTEAGELELVRKFTYEDFLARCGTDRDAAIRTRDRDPLPLAAIEPA